MSYNRRAFLKHSALAGTGLALVGPQAFAAPQILTPRRTHRTTAAGTAFFRPYYVQKGHGQHLDDWGYLSDVNWDAFHSNVAFTPQGVSVSDTHGQERFGVNVRWNVEGFGYLVLTADNGGEYYALPADGRTVEFNLNHELAQSRVARNRKRLANHGRNGFQPSRELQANLDLSEEYFADAEKVTGDELRRGELAQRALYYALWGGEMLELEAARHAVNRIGYRPDFFVGCDFRTWFQEDPDVVMDRFAEVFNYATLTYYLVSEMEDFEPQMDQRAFARRDVAVDALRDRGITVQGRPIFWPHQMVTPQWLRDLSYPDLLRYIERHTRETVGHYGDQMYAWEIVNEFHDWANENNLTPEQTIEVTKLACDVAADTAPNVGRLINNCCPFGEYVHERKHSSGPATHRQRTPWQFMRDLTDAGVDYTITGVQMYFPSRDLQDTIVHIERFEQFGKPVQLTEIGASAGPSRRSVMMGRLDPSPYPYEWHRGWDPELQADWLEAIYTLGYSKPWIEAVNWYDLDDDNSWIRNGGLLESPNMEPRPAFYRLKALQEQWKQLGTRAG